MKKLILVLSLCPLISMANDSLRFDGFMDFYYSYDFNDPSGADRDYTTQPARHDEFNVNLVMLGITHKMNNLSARFSFQAGTYVQSNYSAEPSVGNISGDRLSRNIQDAYIKYQMTEKTHLIAGIMPSHIGYESVFSIDNYTYSRSLAADYSPFYQSGVGVVHELSDAWSVEGYVLNGWQNISENDSNKAMGSAIRFKQDKMSFNYTTFFGRYLERSRQFHDLNAEYCFNEKHSLKVLYDFGTQVMANEKREKFSTFNIQSAWKLTPKHALSVRLERYIDEKQANITTHTNQEFKVKGGSVGYDYLLDEGYVFRTEYRYLKASQNIFKRNNVFDNSNQNLVFSMATKF